MDISNDSGFFTIRQEYRRRVRIDRFQIAIIKSVSRQSLPHVDTDNARFLAVFQSPTHKTPSRLSANENVIHIKIVLSGIVLNPCEHHVSVSNAGCSIGA